MQKILLDKAGVTFWMKVVNFVQARGKTMPAVWQAFSSVDNPSLLLGRMPKRDQKAIEPYHARGSCRDSHHQGIYLQAVW